MNFLRKLIDKHNLKAREERTNRLAIDIIELLNDSKSFLDVGAFDGLLTKKIKEKKKNLELVKAIDAHVPKKTYFLVKKYDGQRIPYPDKSFDSVLLIDVIHHLENPEELLKEVIRVSKKYVIIKDHTYNNMIDLFLLRVVDFLGNNSFDINVKYHFYKTSEWNNLFKKYNLILINKSFLYKQKDKDIIKHILIKLRKRE